MSLLSKQTFVLGDKVFLDIDPEREFVNLRVGNDKGTLIKKVDLWAACFAIADPKTQERLLPIRQTEMSTYVRMHKVRMKKSVNAGDVLNFRCEISVPQIVEEGLAGNLMKKRSKIITPYS